MAKMKRAEKLQIIENLTKGGLSTYEIAVRLGLSKCWIRQRCVKKGRQIATSCR